MYYWPMTSYNKQMYIYIAHVEQFLKVSISDYQYLHITSYLITLNYYFISNHTFKTNVNNE